MRCFSIVFVCATLLVLTGCQGARQQSKPEPARSTQLASKGMELYSWKQFGTKPAQKEDWRFTLLPGTNRNKTLSEITDPKETIVGIDNLKKRLSSLPSGETVVWTDADALVKGSISPASVSIPKYPVPKEMEKELIGYASGLGIELQYCPCFDPGRN